MAAYGLPKRNEEAIEHRRSAIQEALRHATDIPLATAEASLQVLNLAAQACEHGNKHAVGDAVVAALLAHAAILGAIHDVRINLQGLHDAGFCASTEARVAGLAANAEAALERTVGT
jgi:formiminotetrahydrofolate cyclodeaminase